MDVHSDGNHEKRKIQIRGYGFHILMGCLICAVIMWFFDQGPVLPPFGESFQSIDCNSVKFLNYNKTGNKLFLFFQADDSVEYPTPYLPHFLSVDAYSEIGRVLYTEGNIKNLSKKDNIISLSIDYPISGDLNLYLQCLNDDIDNINITVTDIQTPTTDDSASLDPGNDYFVFEKICFDRDIILYFTPPHAEFKSFRYDDQLIKIHTYPFPFSQYAQYTNSTMVNETAYVVSKFDLHWWHAVLFSLGPLADSISRTALNEKQKLLTLGLPQQGNTVLYGRINPQGTVKVKNVTCFRRLVFTGTKYNMDFTHEDDIRYALQLNYSTLRKNYIKSQRFPKRIVLPTCMSHLEDDTKLACPTCEVSSLRPQDDIQAAADIVGRATVFVGNHLNNLALSVFLEPNKTAIVDVSPPKDFCIDYMKDFANHLNVSYFPVHKKPEHCQCKDFKCMQKLPPIEADVDREAYKQAIIDAVALTM
ncbi:hypothetical protein TVAG_426360 [Trichomonas vaginalis G3]|uniref:Uncharacterized protein n=1 Tax=Trichomonas vaginalis (strain ATCC PRA-98 / G3) TaxID=412133 RepID=A2DYQ3_TRIV3|nr:hypothetical protein TVAGG3_0850460 [Trichomonas vaginalis G3]EAY14443.1 hypothetical protein TVAG_426360 [Trichomonas vaginalis G3]KAI5499944.1 hypothetical protein TVAGG3_0850460 [Trichomonas vaginalis G3]|eukprot:XP_001326666.1 hypothetical protein [Trichomonas vaginalis G3]